MKFSEKFKKNKGEAAVPETAQDSGKKKHKPDPKKLVGTISKKHIKNGSYSMAMAAVFIVIVVVINMIVGAIPSKYSQLDVKLCQALPISDEQRKVPRGCWNEMLPFIRSRQAVLRTTRSPICFHVIKMSPSILKLR